MEEFKLREEEKTALEKVRNWLKRHKWEIIPKGKTYRGYDILARDKNGELKKIEVKYRSLPNFRKGTFDISDTELKPCDFCFVVVYGAKPEHEYIGVLKVIPSYYKVTPKLDHRIHVPYIH